MAQVATVEAIYQDGVFKPLRPVRLANNTRVEIRIAQNVEAIVDDSDLGPLAGAFPELASLTDADIEWAKDQWQRGLQRQLDLLRDDGDAE
ncbi:MAG: antitoxin family protein [Anaerolineae bacterium]|jgi:predicted DNA-binding antitoxin AbrB/MazE fold protein